MDMGANTELALELAKYVDEGWERVDNKEIIDQVKLFGPIGSIVDDWDGTVPDQHDDYEYHVIVEQRGFSEIQGAKPKFIVVRREKNP